jgi:hypothetical protein
MRMVGDSMIQLTFTLSLTPFAQSPVLMLAGT